MKEVLAVMRYWLDMGIDGLRLDAIPYLIERDGTNNENLPETHQILKQIRAETFLPVEQSGRCGCARASRFTPGRSP